MDYGEMPEGGSGGGTGPFLIFNKKNFAANEWQGPYKFLKGRLIETKDIPELAKGKFWTKPGGAIEKGQNLYQMRIEVIGFEQDEKYADQEYKGHLVEIAQTSGIGRSFHEARIEEDEEFEVRRVPEGREVTYKDSDTGKEKTGLFDLWEIRRTEEKKPKKVKKDKKDNIEDMDI